MGQVVLTGLLLLAKKVTTKVMMLNLVMLILSNKEKLLNQLLDTYTCTPTTVLLIFTILLQIKLLHLSHYYCFLVQWTTQMVTILESRCPIFISMKPKKFTTLNSYNKIRQTQQLNTYNKNNHYSTTKYLIPQVPFHLLLQPIRALSRSDNYYYDFALTKPSCVLMIIFGLIKTAHSLQRQTDDDNDENENCTNPTQKTKKTNFSII